MKFDRDYLFLNKEKEKQHKKFNNQTIYSV